MQTTFYTFTANETMATGDGTEQASGGSGRRMVYLRHTEPVSAAPEGGKLIDFHAWCSEHEAELHANEEPLEEETMEEEEKTVCRERTMRSGRIGMYLDWIASAALAAVAVSACIGVLF